MMLSDSEKDDSVVYHRNSKNTIKKLHETCNWDQLDNVAIEHHDTQEIIYITYRDLLATTNMISDYLKCLNISEFVGIDVDLPEYCAISVMLGILNSECSFVTIAQNTADSLNLQNNLNVRYIFCKEMHVEGDVLHQFLIHSERIYLGKLKHVQSAINNVEHCSYAYAISTSGSTGTPKVVKVLHSSIVPNILDLSKILAIKGCDKISQFTNFTFDPSIVEIYLALSNAATLFTVSRSLRNNPNRLLEAIYGSHVTVIQMTPTVFLHSWTPERLRNSILSNNTSLRAILLGGEPFPRLELFHEIKHPGNSTKFYNMYGITEVSCWASINEILPGNGPQDVQDLGHVLSHTEFEVRNERGEVVTNGTGTLFIGSRQRICVLDNENIQDLELPMFRDTGDVVEVNKEGRVFYKGRQNSIVKRFGNKVDLRILEDFVLQIDFIKCCYAVWDDDHRQLHLCLVAKEKASNSHVLTKHVKKHLNKLDQLYRPDKIHFLAHVEFTSSGKISLNFLKENYVKGEKQRSTPMDISNMEEIENTFKNIWKENLRCEDNGFVKLGGTSLAALRITNTVSDTFNLEFPDLIGMLLMDSTMSECLNYIKSIALRNIGNETSTDCGSELSGSRKKPLISIVAIENVSLEASEMEKAHCDSTPDISETYTCEWYKCRGQECTNLLATNKRHKIQCDSALSVKVLKAYDLKKCVDASPTVFHYSNGKTYATVGSHSGLIFTFELENTCTAVYKVKLPGRIEASILVLDNFRGIVGCYDGRVYCLDLKTGDTIWKHQTGDIIKCTAIPCGKKETVFVGSYDCHVYCLSIKDGSEVWKRKCSNGSITATGCIHFPSNTVLFGTLEGTCLALEQSSGAIVWKRKLPDPIFVAPVSLNNGHVLFCSVTGHLCCFDIQVNIKLWTYKINGNVFSYLVRQYNASTNHESVIIASQNKNMYCLQLEDRTEPTLKYVLSFHSPIVATPWCIDDCIFTACMDGTLNIYNVATNRLVRIEKLPGEVFSSPVVENNILIVGCRDNFVYVLQLVRHIIVPPPFHVSQS